MTTATSAPLRQNERIQFIDSVRGIALLGILLMNITAQSQAHFFYDKMDIRQSLTGLNFYAWGGEMLLFEGTMRGLFSILFGAGTILLLTRLTRKMSGLEPADIYYRRLLWLLAFGLVNAFIFLWPGDILYPYALCGLLLFPFRNLSPRNMLWIAFAFLVIATYRENSDLYKYRNMITKGEAVQALEAQKVKLNDEQKGQLDDYKNFKERASSQGIVKRAEKEEHEIKGKGYLPIFRYFRDMNMRLESQEFYEFGIWDILLCFFIGMALFKSGYLLGHKPTAWYAVVAVLGIGTGIALNYFYLRDMYQLKFDMFLLTKKWTVSYYEIRRVCQTLGYLSLLILLYKLLPFRKVMHLLAPVGQMAFTNYLSQSIVTSVLFYGFGLYASLQRYEIYYVVAAIWLFQIITSHIWLRYFRFGPFEWLWRSLTYLKKQPMRRKAASAGPEEEIREGSPAPALA